MAVLTIVLLCSVKKKTIQKTHNQYFEKKGKMYLSVSVAISKWSVW